jgi:hypothetical protein
MTKFEVTIFELEMFEINCEPIFLRFEMTLYVEPFHFEMKIEPCFELFHLVEK